MPTAAATGRQAASASATTRPSALDFVSERPRSLAVHVLEQIELMFADAAERRIALKLAEGLDEAGYCRLDAPAVAEAVQRRPRHDRGGVDPAAPDRAGRLVRPHRRRVPGRAARRAQSPRSGDEGPARQSRPGGRGRARPAAPPLRRRRRGSARDAVGAAHARSASRPGLRLRADPAGRSPISSCARPRMPTPARRAGTSSSTPMRCPRCWSTATTTPR